MSLNLIPPIVVLNSVSLATNEASSGIHIMYVDNIGISFVWTGTPVGTFGVSVCNDATVSETGAVTGGNWSPLVLTSPNPPAPSGTSGTGNINLTGLGFAFLQVTYTATSGTGTATATLTAKGV